MLGEMQEPDFGEIVTLICKEDPRFDRRAYEFVRQALDFTVRELRAKPERQQRKSMHVAGPELLDGFRRYAIEQFGPLTVTVLAEWGMTRCEDVGEIVFNLIEYNVFSKTADDRREDFRATYTFEEAFLAPFRPKKSLKKGSRTSAPRFESPEPSKNFEA